MEFRSWSLAAAVVYSGYIYTTGGVVQGASLTSTVFYAPINVTGSVGNWTSTTALPSVLQEHSTLVNSGYIYTIGGNSFSDTSTVFYAPINATGSVGNWTSTTPLPSAIRNHSAVVYNGYIYSTGEEVAAPPPSSMPQSTQPARSATGQARLHCRAP